ncbi:MAG: SPOR domain-containing protein [Burkholderiales bacterium]|nr:SPOR domain-containing protein [Burkholderiales bacterium]
MANKSGFGTWFYGFLVGGVVGVAVCGVAAYYITNAPIPFVNKVNQPSEKINPLSAGKVPDPNLPLASGSANPANAPKSKVVPVEAPTPEESEAETKIQTEQGSRFVVQAGSFNNAEGAENRRMALGFLGYESHVIQRSDHGSTVYRVRLGPYGTAAEANNIKAILDGNSIPAVVERIK